MRQPGPDEDAFTLSLASLETLGTELRGTGRNVVRRAQLLGAFAPETEWGVGEALGLPDLEVERHPAGPHALWSAFSAATHAEGAAGRELVVVAETAPPLPPGRWGGAAAVAFLFGSEAGLSFLRHGLRGLAPHRRPSAAGLVEGWVGATGVAPGGSRGEVLLVSDEEPLRLLKAWEERAPGISVAPATGEATRYAGGSSLTPAFALFELVGRLRLGGMGMVAELRRGRSGYAGFRLDAPVRWRGPWTEPGPGLSPPTPRFLEPTPASVDAVSEGAYVPYPRYVENLPSRWRLAAHRCGRCGSLTFPLRGFCRSCGSREGLVVEHLPREAGEVEAVTTIRPGAQPTEFDPQVERAGGYDVVLVRLAPGVRVTLQVTDAAAGAASVGARVRTVLRRLYPMEGEWRYGLKAVLAESPGGARPASVGIIPSPPAPASSDPPRGSRATTRRSSARDRSAPRRG